MRAAFSPPPKALETDKAGQEGPGRDSLENPMFTDRGAPGSEAIHSVEVPTKGAKPIEPALLEPLDSTSVEVVKERLQQPKYAQAKQKKLETSPDSFTPDIKPRRRHRRKLSPPASDTETVPSSRHGGKQSRAIMGSTGSGSSRMQGQDSLEVRSVTLANGQKASLILEEGKLQRIVAANGQVAELRWNPPPLTRVAAGPQRHRQLSVKVHRGASPSDGPSSTATGPLPSSIRRWANSFNSQRLTTGSFKKQSLMSAPGAFAGLNSREIRKTTSLDFSAGKGPRKRRSFMNSLFSLPTASANAKTASQADMPAIMETNREVHRDWNPIHESWLPSTMTDERAADQGAGNSQEGNARQPPAAATRTGGGRKVSDPKTFTRSLDSANPTYSPTYGGGSRRADREGRPRRSSAEITGMHSVYDSDAGYSDAESRKKFKFWKLLKRLLHLPTVSKPSRSPRASSGTAQRKNRSFGVMSIRRLSQGTGRAATQPVYSDADFAPENEVSEDERPSSAPDMSQRLDAGDAGRRFKSQSMQPLRKPQAEAEPSGRRQAEHFVPATPQQPRQQRREAASASPMDTEGMAVEGPAVTEEIFATPSRSLHTRMSNSDLIDTTELRAALAHRRSAREASRESDDGSEKPRSRSSRRLGDVAEERHPRQRTMMAGKWQKNFTEGTSGSKVDELLQVSSLQRLARERIVEMEIVETEETFEMIWHIPLNGSSSKISKTDRYLKNGEVVEAARRDGRPGVLRSQLTFTPEGHVHIRALQGEPFSAVFHDRIKLSTGGRRIKIEQKFQLLQPGVLPVKHYSIWTRVE